MMAKMLTLIAELDSILNNLRRLKRPVVPLLQNPLTPDAIHRRLQDIHLCPSDELVNLYCWKNGTRVTEGDVLNDLHFWPGYYFLSLEDAVCDYKILVDSQWKPDWFPVFGNYGGDFYALELSDRPRTQSQVIDFLRGEPSQPVAFESLLTMTRTISACYELGIYYVTAEGYLGKDYYAEDLIAKRFNPTIDRSDR